MSLETQCHDVSLVLADYFEGRLPEFRAASVEEHLADCAACLTQARRVRRILYVWNDSPAAAMQALAHARLTKRLAVAEAEPSFAAVRDKLRQWRARLEGWKRSAMEAISLDPSEIEGFAADTTLLGAGARLAVEYRGVRRRGSRSGHAAPGRGTLLPGGPPLSSWEITWRGSPGAGREVIVRLTSVHHGRIPAVLALLPETPGLDIPIAPVRAIALEAAGEVPAKVSYEASFFSLPHGIYTIAVHPL